MAGAGNVRSITRDFEHWVRTVDPEREHENWRVLEYEFGSGVHRRLFYADPNKRGAYGDRVIGPPVIPIEPPIIEPPIEPEVEATFYIVLEDGFKILLEDGSGALLSEIGGGSALLEDGSKLLLETGETLGLE